jgi:guanosine-3',5'-bis(diphosphate) 3'-pyrophosphohydrolase
MTEASVKPPKTVSNFLAVQAVLRAANFAAVKHAKQRRKGASAEPYINHLLEVAELVWSALSEPDTNLVIAALLHDSIEDAGVTKEELVEAFGVDVADLVMEVTDEKSLPRAERKRLQILNAPKISVRAGIIELADKLANVRSILVSPPPDWSVQRQREYFEWAKQVVDGLRAPNVASKAEFERVYRQGERLGQF